MSNGQSNLERARALRWEINGDDSEMPFEIAGDEEAFDVWLAGKLDAVAKAVRLETLREAQTALKQRDSRALFEAWLKGELGGQS